MTVVRWLSCVLFILCWSGVALADTAETYAKAVELYQQKNCDAALPLFREAHAASQSPNARLFIARCLEQQGELTAAYEEMRTTVEEATAKAAGDPKYAPTRDSAAAELALLDVKVGKLIIAVADPPPDTVVSVNDTVIDSAQLGKSAAVLPGTAVVKVEAPGKKPAVREIEVPAGETRTVAIALQDADDEAAVGAPDPEPVDDGDDGGGGAGFGTVRIAGFVVAGVGLVGVGVFAALATMAKSDFDELDEQCGGQPCPQSEKERVDDGRTQTLVANVSLGIGAACVVGGVLMIVFGGEDGGVSEAAGLELAPMVAPDAAGVMIGGRF